MHSLWQDEQMNICETCELTDKAAGKSTELKDHVRFIVASGLGHYLTSSDRAELEEGIRMCRSSHRILATLRIKRGDEIYHREDFPTTPQTMEIYRHQIGQAIRSFKETPIAETAIAETAIAETAIAETAIAETAIAETARTTIQLSNPINSVIAKRRLQRRRRPRMADISFENWVKYFAKRCNIPMSQLIQLPQELQILYDTPSIESFDVKQMKILKILQNIKQKLINQKRVILLENRMLFK
jgi:hypothetical protein